MTLVGVTEIQARSTRGSALLDNLLPSAITSAA